MKLSQLNKIFFTPVFFIAPMGKMLIPFEIMSSFRAFYLYLPVSAIYLYLNPKIDSKVKFFCFLYFFLCTISIIININLLDDSDFNKNPFSRVIIHNLISSFFVLSSWIALNSSTEYRWFIIKNVVNGFTVTLIIGFLVYIAVIMGVLPMQLYENMNVITQMGYGFLRFSPGSYPNEFGIMSAYFCILAVYLIICNNTVFNKKYLYFVFFLSFAGMVLSTTRAAYLSFAISFIYLFISFKLNHKIKFVIFSILIAVVSIMLIPDTVFQYASGVLEKGYNSALSSAGSVEDRYIAWKEAWNLFQGNLFFGVGFENPQISMAHNTYLQFLFGFGVIGIIFLSIICFMIVYIFKKQYETISNKCDAPYRNMAFIGLIHVLSFALTNHNQNHFLTWFTVFLFLSSGCLSKK